MLYIELVNIVCDVDNDDGVKVLVFIGVGCVFCVGGDFGGGDDVIMGCFGFKEMREIVDYFLDCSIFVILVVRGYVMGLGVIVVLLVDIVVVGKFIMFVDIYVNMGIGVGDGG